jgi:hypothetical protein
VRKSSSVSQGKPTRHELPDLGLGAPAVHPLEDRVADVLDRDIQVLADLGLGLDDLDEPVGDPVGVGVEEPDPP